MELLGPSRGKDFGFRPNWPGIGPIGLELTGFKASAALFTSAKGRVNFGSWSFSLGK